MLVERDDQLTFADLAYEHIPHDHSLPQVNGSLAFSFVPELRGRLTRTRRRLRSLRFFPEPGGGERRRHERAGVRPRGAVVKVILSLFRGSQSDQYWGKNVRLNLAVK